MCFFPLLIIQWKGNPHTHYLIPVRHHQWINTIYTGKCLSFITQADFPNKAKAETQPKLSADKGGGIVSDSVIHSAHTSAKSHWFYSEVSSAPRKDLVSSLSSIVTSYFQIRKYLLILDHALRFLSAMHEDVDGNPPSPLEDNILGGSCSQLPVISGLVPGCHSFDAEGKQEYWMLFHYQNEIWQP